MKQDAERTEELFQLATLVHSIARRLPAPGGLQPGPCTPLEIDVMGYVGANPGTSAGAAAVALGLPTSNFSRVLKRLVDKGLVRREPDERDARRARLHPTDLAQENRQLMRDAWSASLDGALPDPAAIEALCDQLTHIDRHLTKESP